MKQKLIKLSDTHYIVVDNFKKPVINDFIIDINNPKSIRQIKTNYLLEDLFENEKKITHSTQPLEQYYSAMDGSIPFVFHKIKQLSLSDIKEVIYEYNYHTLTKQACIKYDIETNFIQLYTLFIEGFKAHQEIVKDKFILTKDQIKFIYNTVIHAIHGNLNLDEEFNRVLKFISSKTEWDIEFNEQNKIKLV